MHESADGCKLKRFFVDDRFAGPGILRPVDGEGLAGMRQLLYRIAKTVFGIFISSVGYYLCIPANVGLSPWPAFSMGLSYATGLSYGDVTILVSVLIVALDCLLGEKIGFATVLDALLTGKFIDLFLRMELVPMCDGFLSGIAVLLIGQVFVSVGIYFYIGPGLGAGPRDSLMVALGKRFPAVPIGAVRALLEGTVLAIGWLLGAKIGVGTVISVFGIGFILQLTLKLLRFDVTAVRHEGLFESVRRARASA